MRVFLAILLFVVAVGCFFMMISSYQVAESARMMIWELDYQLLNDHVVYNMEDYRALEAQEVFYGRIFLAAIFGMIISAGSSGAVLYKD